MLGSTLRNGTFSTLRDEEDGVVVLGDASFVPDDDVVEEEGVEAIEETEVLFRVLHDPDEPSLGEIALEDGIDPHVPKSDPFEQFAEFILLEVLLYVERRLVHCSHRGIESMEAVHGDDQFSVIAKELVDLLEDLLIVGDVLDHREAEHLVETGGRESQRLERRRRRSGSPTFRSRG